MNSEKEIKKLSKEMAQFFIDNNLLSDEMFGKIKDLKSQYLTPAELEALPIEEFADRLKVNEKEARDIKHMLEVYGFFNVEEAKDVMYRDDFQLDFAIMFDCDERKGTTYQLLCLATLCEGQVVYKSTFFSLFCLLRDASKFKEIFPDADNDVFKCFRLIAEELNQKTGIMYNVRDLSDLLEYYFMRKEMEKSWLEDHKTLEGLHEEIIKMIKSGINVPFKAEPLSSAFHEWYKPERRNSTLMAMTEITCDLEEHDLTEVLMNQYFNINIVRKKFDVDGYAALLLVAFINQKEYQHIDIESLKEMLHGSTTLVLRLLENVPKLIEKKYVEEISFNDTLLYRLTDKTFAMVLDCSEEEFQKIKMDMGRYESKESTNPLNFKK